MHLVDHVDRSGRAGTLSWGMTVVNIEEDVCMRYRSSE
jgi:hypothetical protein